MKLKDSVNDFLILCFVEVIKIHLSRCVRNMPKREIASSMVDYHATPCSSCLK